MKVAYAQILVLQDSVYNYDFQIYIGQIICYYMPIADAIPGRRLTLPRSPYRPTADVELMVASFRATSGCPFAAAGGAQ